MIDAASLRAASRSGFRRGGAKRELTARRFIIGMICAAAMACSGLWLAIETSRAVLKSADRQHRLYHGAGPFFGDRVGLAGGNAGAGHPWPAESRE